MKISELQKELQKIKEHDGDINIHMEIIDTCTCPKCGAEKDNNKTGTLRRVHTLNVDGELHVWLLGDVK